MPESPRRFLTVLWVLVVAILLVTPLVMVPYSFDVFRTPKDAVFVSLSLLLIAALAGGALLSDDAARLLRMRAPIVFVALAAPLWTAVVTLTSMRPGVSLYKPLTVVCCSAFVVATLLTVKGRHFSALMVVLAPAAVNSLLATVQSTGVWQPWAIDPRIPFRLRTTGLIGNPNDLGTYLTLPALAAFAAAIAWPRRKWMYGVAVLFLIGIASAQSVTPVVAAVAGLFVMAVTSTTRRLRYATFGALAALIVIAAVHPASRTRFARLFESAAIGRLPELTSMRVVPAATAWRMFLDRPLVGVGPGGFSALYMTAKLETDAAYPQWIRVGADSFSQVHNDHLQVLAETGLPGYAIFIAALGLLGAITFRRGEVADERVRFARTFAFPAAVSFAMLTLAQFPLQLTAPMVPALYLGALCFAWTAGDESV
ncbi:MAG TPA: O-antigen ligase family protein [Thermoanaerobaculia bacterium]|nr:O-antigen ligase family protein [Thermoanaerobaculia bacterium]